jgi:hypothetical protein
MKNLIGSMLAAALVTAFAGCATESNESNEPTEATVTSNVWEHATNYVTCTNKLARRTCADPGGCDTGDRMALGTRLEVDVVNWSNKMAHFTSSPYGAGWALANNDGEVYISRDPGVACD